MLINCQSSHRHLIASDAAMGVVGSWTGMGAKEATSQRTPERAFQVNLNAQPST